MPKLLMLIIISILGSVLFAYNLYVSPTGDPINADGSYLNPYRNIQQAIDHAFNDALPENTIGASVEIIVADNSQGYQEELSIVYYALNGSLHNVQDITVKSVSDNPDNCKIVVPANSSFGVQVSGTDESQIKFQGIGVERYPGSSTYFGIWFTQDPTTSNAPILAMDRIDFDHCIFSEFPRAISAQSILSIDTFSVVNSEFYDTGTSQNHKCFALYSNSVSNHAKITGNIIKIENANNLDPTMYAYLQLGQFHDIEFNNNEFYNAAIDINASDELEVKNNVFTYSPISIGGEIEVDCINNTFVSDNIIPYSALSIIKDTSEPLVISHNQFFNCKSSIFFDLVDGDYAFRILNNHMFKNSFIDCEKILNVRVVGVQYTYPPVSVFRDNLYSGLYTDLFTITDEYNDPFVLTGNSRIPISYCHFSNPLVNTASLNLDASSISYGNAYLSVDLQNHSYTQLWDINVKSPTINTGCPEIDGVSQSDPDGTPPDIGARYYPHHHRKYFDRTDGSGIYWLSFPVLDDKSQTNGSYWNELGFMFNEYMDEEYQALNQIHWSYDTDVDDMSYDPWSLQWLNTGHTAEQPKGYKVKFNPELNYDPLLVNGFKADPVTTPVAWVEEYLHNGQMQDFLNMIGYFVPDTQDAGYALSRNLPRSSRFTYLDFVHTIKTRNWSTYRISEEMYSPWIIDPDTYTLSEGDMVALLLLPGAPEEMYWNVGLHVAPRERPRATAFSYEEKLDYTSLIIEFDPDDLPREVGVYIDGECKGASVVDSSVVDICVYPDEAKSGGEASIVFYYEGKGAKAAQGWKLYNPKSMVFEDGTLSLSAKDKYSYISFKHKAGDSPVPLVTALHQNYPNPFNPDTNISFILGSDMPVILDVFNIKGQKVKRLCDRELPRGQHSIQWNGRDADNRPVASGMYFYRLSSPEGVQTRKMMLMK